VLCNRNTAKLFEQAEPASTATSPQLPVAVEAVPAAATAPVRPSWNNNIVTRSVQTVLECDFTKIYAPFAQQANSSSAEQINIWCVSASITHIGKHETL